MRLRALVGRRHEKARGQRQRSRGSCSSTGAPGVSALQSFGLLVLPPPGFFGMQADVWLICSGASVILLLLLLLLLLLQALGQCLAMSKHAPQRR